VLSIRYADINMEYLCLLSTVFCFSGTILESDYVTLKVDSNADSYFSARLNSRALQDMLQRIYLLFICLLHISRTDNARFLEKGSAPWR
jgi:hypothetical protein